MIESFKRASADRITAVIPYFGYARQDRKDEGRVPITAKLVANLITRAGADRVLAMDLHAAQIQGFFDIPVDHLYAAPVIDEHFKAMDVGDDEFVVVSPDEGSIKRALAHMARLGGHLAIIDKRRSTAEKTKQANVIGGPVEGRVALIFDDMISTAGSICGAAEVMHQHGAQQIYLAATHGLLVGGAVERLQKAPIDGLVLTDTIPHPARERDPQADRARHRPLAGRSHQAHPPQRIGEPAVRVVLRKQGCCVQKRLAFSEPSISVEKAAAPEGYAGIYGFHKYWGKKPHEPIAYAIEQLTRPGTSLSTRSRALGHPPAKRRFGTGDSSVSTLTLSRSRSPS